MLQDSQAFSSFSVDDLDQAKRFYVDELGLHVDEVQMGLELKIAGSIAVYIYEKPDHRPALFTILNFPVDNIDAAIDELAGRGVVFEQYDFGDGAKTDEKGVMRGLAANMGPDIAWFKDPSGNVLAVLQAK